MKKRRCLHFHWLSKFSYKRSLWIYQIQMIMCTTIFELHFKHLCSCVINGSRVCGSIAPLILQLRTTQRQVITPQTLFSSWKRHQEQMSKRHIGPLEPSERLRGEKISYHCRESNYFFQLSDQYLSPILTALSRLPRYLSFVMYKSIRLRYKICEVLRKYSSLHISILKCRRKYIYENFNN